MATKKKSTRNSLAGSKRGTSKSARYFQKNKKARDKKNAYNKEYHATKERKKYRAKLNKANRNSPNGPKKDKSHTKSGKLTNERASKNRARNGKSGKSSKK